MPPVPPVRPSSSESSVEAPTDGRRKCSSCPRRVSKKSADRHTVCVSCRGFDCDVDCRCDECLESSSEEIIKYAKYRKSLKSRDSSSRKTAVPAPPLTTSGPSSQPPPLPAQQPAPLPAQPPALRPAQRDELQSQVDSLSSNFQSLSDTLTTQLRDFMLMFSSQNQLSCQPRLGPDAGETHPGGTVGESRMFQGEGAPSRTPLASSHGFQPSGAFAAPFHRAPHPAPLRVPPPVRLRMLCLRLAQPRNPPRLGGFLLALLLRLHVLNMTRRGLSLRPVSPSVSPLPVTLPLRVWLTSSMRSALPRVRSLTPRLRVATLRLGSASLRLRLRGSASACTPAWRRCWRSLWLVVPGHFPGLFLRVRTPWLTTPYLRHPSR